MMQQGVNPNYQGENDYDDKYTTNCTSCTVAAELVIRGFNVEAVSALIPEVIAIRPSSKSAYIDPKTDNECIPDIIYIDEIGCYEYLEKNVMEGERYELAYNTPTEGGNDEYDRVNENRAHVVLVTRNKDLGIIVYDPQTYSVYENKKAKLMLDSWFQYKKQVIFPRILRVDDKSINQKYINKIVKKADTN